MGIGDAFLGAELVASAIADGLAGDGSRLGAALAMYQSTFRERTTSVYEYTLRAASLKDPSPMLPLYAQVARSPEETTRFMNVLAGTVDFKRYFTASNIARLLA